MDLRRLMHTQRQCGGSPIVQENYVYMILNRCIQFYRIEIVPGWEAWCAAFHYELHLVLNNHVLPKNKLLSYNACVMFMVQFLLGTLVT